MWYSKPMAQMLPHGTQVPPHGTQMLPHGTQNKFIWHRSIFEAPPHSHTKQ